VANNQHALACLDFQLAIKYLSGHFELPTAQCYLELGRVQVSLAEDDQALVSFANALSIFEERGKVGWSGYVMMLQGRSLRRIGHEQMARKCLTEAHALLDFAGLLVQANCCLLELAIVELQLGNIEVTLEILAKTVRDKSSSEGLSTSALADFTLFAAQSMSNQCVALGEARRLVPILALTGYQTLADELDARIKTQNMGPTALVQMLIAFV
jgi:tetratricopeptide (TPR) repeat protein